jgi:hypothetical protein
MIEGQDTRQEDKRQAFREKLAALDDAELARRMYCIGLVQRLDNEINALATLFGDPNEPLRLTPPPDVRVTGLAHLFQQELKRRAIAATKIVHIEEGEENHANNNGTH